MLSLLHEDFKERC